MKLLLENWRGFLKEGNFVIPTINKPILFIYDFDETIAQSTGFIIATHKETDEELKITTQEEYDELKVTDKYDFDFSNLALITDPTEIIPITKQLRKDIKNPNAQILILTARTGDVQDEIHLYLESIKIDSSDVIIIGCSGCDKGEFVERMIEHSPEIKTIVFYDDSQENVRNLLRSKNTLSDKLETFKIVDVSDPENWKLL